MANVLYLAVVEDIKKKIFSGELRPNDMLKSESELIKEYNVSRMTLRKSLSLLSNQGYIYSSPGKGNFIRKPDTDIYQFRFNEYESLAAQVDEIKLISVTVSGASDNIKANLSLAEDGQIVRIERLILSRNQPIAFEVVNTPYIPNKPVVEEKLNFASFPQALVMKLAFAIKKEIEIKIINADNDICKKLGIKQNEDIFQVNKKIINKENNLILTYSFFYVKKEFFVLNAKTPEEDKSKKIF